VARAVVAALALAAIALDCAAQARPEPLRGALALGDVVRRALQSNAAVQIQAQQVRIGEGAVQQARGVYDPEIVGRAEVDRNRRPLPRNETADLLASRGAEIAEERGAVAQYRLGVEQNLESGMRYDAGFSVNSTTTNVNDANGIPRQTTGNLRFGLRVPLQRNASGIQFAGPLRAGEFERDATVEDLLQTSASVVLSTVQAYWELAARLRRLEILRESEQRAADLVGELKRLIAVDQVPAAELNLAVASEAEKRAARGAEEQALQQVWSALARLLGSGAGEVLAAGAGTDPLPEPSEEAVRAMSAASADLDAALERRADLRAARLRERSAHELVLVSANGTRPQLDLLVNASTAGLAEGASAVQFGPALTERRVDPALSLALELRWPWRNDVAKGQLLSRSAAHDQATLRTRELERSIGPAVLTAEYSLRRTAERLRETESAVERYALSVKNERTKRRLGLSTLIDVINVQDRLDAAQLSQLQLRQEYAQLLAQLYFELGTLVLRAPGGFEVDMPALVGRPALAPRR
jgi:outer membrane protein TolC